MKIDIFNHFMPKPYLERLAALIPGHAAVTAFPRLATLCDVEARLRLLDEFGDLQNVLSLANPPLELIAGPDLTPDSPGLRTMRSLKSVRGTPTISLLLSPHYR